MQSIAAIVGEFKGLKGKAPERFLVFKHGKNVARGATIGDDVVDQVEFTMDVRSAEAIIKAFEGKGNEVPIDYEHQTVGGKFARADGLSPAAGWVTGFEWEDGVGLFALARWTETGGNYVGSEEYRYHSPTFSVDENSGRISEIFAIALTNTPAILDSVPLAAKAHYMVGHKTGVKTMPNKTFTTRFGTIKAQLDEEAAATTPEEFMGMLRELLGLADDASMMAIIEAINALREAASKAPADEPTEEAVEEEVSETAAKALGVKAKTLKQLKSAVVAKYTPVAGSTVPTAELAKVQARCEAMEQERHDEKRETFIAKGMGANGEAIKITAGTRAMWEMTYNNDPEKAAEFLKAADVVLPSGVHVSAVSGNASDLIPENTPPDRRELLVACRTYQKEHKCTMTEAVEAVGALTT